MTASALVRHGIAPRRGAQRRAASWLRRHGFASVDELRGLPRRPAEADTAAHGRAGYVAALEKARRTYGDLGTRTGATASAEPGS